jgi:hypothetical protein
VKVPLPSWKTMADVLPANQRTLLTAEPRTIPQPIDTRPPPAVPTKTLQVSSGIRSGHLSLDTFSPVNQNGSFAFDRVLRSGEVNKRTRKTKVSFGAWLCLNWALLTLEFCSNGNPSTSSFAPTFSPSTKPRPKSAFSSRSASPI